MTTSTKFKMDPFTLLDEVQNEKAKQSIRTKCNDYLERAEKLKGYLNKKGKEKVVATGENDKK